MSIPSHPRSFILIYYVPLLRSLAYAELYHVIAAFACSFDWELHETGLEDVRTTRDFQLAVPESGSLAIKIVLTGTVG
jgi:hypothetical protein